MTLVPNKKLGQKNTARRRLVVIYKVVRLSHVEPFGSKRIALVSSCL